jgi:hypothetical protein
MANIRRVIIRNHPSKFNCPCLFQGGRLHAQLRAIQKVIGTIIVEYLWIRKDCDSGCIPNHRKFSRRYENKGTECCDNRKWAISGRPQHPRHRNLDLLCGKAAPRAFGKLVTISDSE